MVEVLHCDFNILFHCFALKVDGKLYDLKKDVAINDAKHRKTLAEVSLNINFHFSVLFIITFCPAHLIFEHCKSI